jgi:hypothetical protein
MLTFFRTTKLVTGSFPFIPTIPKLVVRLAPATALLRLGFKTNGEALTGLIFSWH